MPWPIAMILRIAPFLLIAYFYVGWKASSALLHFTHGSALLTRLGMAALILLFNLLPLAVIMGYRRGAGSMFFLNRPRLHWQDFAFNFPFWIGLIIAAELLAYFLLMDIISGALYFSPRLSPWWKSLKPSLTLLLVLFFVIYVPARAYRDTYRVRTTNYRIQVADLPEGLRGLRLGFISDVQVDRYTGPAKLNQVARILRETSPDLLLFGGDLVTSGKSFIPAGLTFLCQTTAPLGRIACMGDHDYWANPNRIRNGLRQCNWTFLENAHSLINYRGASILITGITYIYSFKTPPETMRSLLENAPPADLKILLVHQPSPTVLALAHEYGYQLVLAGHTHGGQVVFRPFGFSLTPTRFESNFYRGLGYFKGMPVLVTNGVGRTLAPLRYQAPAEVVHISLQPE